MADDLLSQARRRRDLLLRAEVGGWLHDLGKLSRAFVRSKTDLAYVTEAAEQETPPAATSPTDDWHHSQVLEQDGRREIFAAPLPLPDGWEPVSIADLVAGHHSPGRDEWLLKLLRQADGQDSGEDEYNAVGLNQREPVQAATLFGREEPLADGDLTALDEARLALYDKLQPLLENPVEKRAAIWSLLSETLRQGLGKTQRAANDVRLDQHTWGVAARFKAFLLRDLLDPPPADAKRPRRTFRLLTVRWNWWEAVAPFARLSDLVGRVVMLEELRAELRRLVEEEYALGNRIYEDDDGVHFLIAAVDWDEAELTRRLRRRVDEITGGEVQPVVRLGPATGRIADLTAQMKAARATLPAVGEPAWVQTWAHTPSGVVCPVCRRRPLEGDRDLCPWCERRRGVGAGRRLGREGTVWSGEIADERGRVALLVARFDLDEWLDGTMLHTLFITSPQDLAAVPSLPLPVQDWQTLREAIERLPAHFLEPVSSPDEIPAREKQVRRWGRERQDTPEGALARRLAARFGRLQYTATVAKDLQRRYALPLADAVLLALARKNPSAGRLLRVWQTTAEFLKAQAAGLQEQLETRERAVLTLKGRPRPGLYTAELPGLGPVDLFIRREDGKAQTISRLSPAQIARLRGAVGRSLRLLTREDGKRVNRAYAIAGVAAETYRPCQVIALSPNLLLAMLPAGEAVEAAERLRRAYAAEFGKVQGRLPFHVGLVLMNAHYPMFAALDAARRLVGTFDALGKEWAEAMVQRVEVNGQGDYTLTLHSDRFGRWVWRVPARRGDGETDWYHPYLLVREGEGVEGRGMSLIGPGGRWVHVSQVQAGDRVAFRPNLFDFLFLDTVSRRLEAHADPRTGRRPHPLLGPERSPRPYLLERVGDLKDTWETIRRIAGISETRLNAVTTLLARKWRAWMSDPAAQQSYEWLVEETIARDLGGETRLKETILEGLFFDVVELYRHVLKQSVAPSGEEAR